MVLPVVLGKKCDISENESTCRSSETARDSVRGEETEEHDNYYANSHMTYRQLQNRNYPFTPQPLSPNHHQ